MKALYRKINDLSLSSSTYHKKDGTNVRMILKESAQREVKNYINDTDSVTAKLHNRIGI